MGRRKRRYPVVLRYPVCMRYPVTEEDLRPRIREACGGAPRPCPHVGCKYNLYLDVGANGALTFRWGEREPDEIPYSCVLDMAAQQGSLGTFDLAELLALDPDLVRREVEAALNAVRYKLARSRMGREFKDGL